MPSKRQGLRESEQPKSGNAKPKPMRRTSSVACNQSARRRAREAAARRLRAVRKITEAVNAELEALRIGNVELKTNFASLRPSLAKLQAEVHEAKVVGRKPSKPGVIDLPAMRVAQ